MNIYDHMKAYLKDNIVDKIHSYPLPDSVVRYMNVRRAALSNAFTRSLDTMHQHVSDSLYFQHLQASMGDPVDAVAWELFYSEVAAEMGVPIAAVQCVVWGLSNDPAYSNAPVKGLADAVTPDGKTTPPYVALACALAEDMDWDITEMYPPLAALHPDALADMSKQISQLVGMTVEDPLTYLSEHSGVHDVTLA